MSWLFSRALVEAFSEASSLDGEPCAPLSVMPTLHKFWRNGKTMECSTLSQFGLTCAVLTEGRGAELLTLFLEASRARTSPVPGRAQGSTGNALGSGLNLLGSLARFDPASSSWKTPQCSLVEGLDEFSETWPRWGSMRNGVCWARTTLAPLTSENESGSWPTPVANETGRTPEAFLAMRASMKGGPRTSITSLAVAVKVWPTPTVNGNHNRKGLSPQSGDGLATAVAKAFPTPCARDYRSPNKLPFSERGGGRKGEQLVNFIAHQFPTPTATNTKANHMRGDDKGKEREARSYGVEGGGQLNPPWVEWLMGWPEGWTDLKPLATAKYQRWLHSHGKPSCAA